MTGVSGDTDTLATLLRRVSAQDEDAFARFYDLTRARVYGMVLRVLRDPGYSEETTQEVFLQVWRTAESFDEAQGSALSWVITLAHRRAVDRVRSEQSG
jgi:RNA polymerase sigma-70 factor (ECF subfamily)